MRGGRGDRDVIKIKKKWDWGFASPRQNGLIVSGFMREKMSEKITNFDNMIRKEIKIFQKDIS